MDIWRTARAELKSAFRAWAKAPLGVRRARQRAYRAASDREARAAAAPAAALRAPSAEVRA